ncbi:hypothetical protein M407DRAFT_24256, partial [Tulasnella calospora MUT 4182]
VKALATLPVTLPSEAQTTYLTTIGSDGKIHLYDLLDLPPSSNATSAPPDPPQILPIATYDTKGSRLTSLTMADGAPPQTAGKRKRDGDEDEDEEEAEWMDFSSDEGRPNGDGEEAGDEEEDVKEDEEVDDEDGWGGVGAE